MVNTGADSACHPDPATRPCRLTQRHTIVVTTYSSLNFKIVLKCSCLLVYSVRSLRTLRGLLPLFIYPCLHCQKLKDPAWSTSIMYLCSMFRYPYWERKILMNFLKKREMKRASTDCVSSWLITLIPACLYSMPNISSQHKVD